MLVLLLPMVAKADFIKVAEYTILGETYEITADTPNKKGKYTIFLYIKSKIDGKSLLEISSKNINDIHDALVEAKKKYIEWDSLARANKVESFSREMDIKMNSFVLSWYYGTRWWSVTYHYKKPTFIYDKESNHSFLSYIFNVPAEDNRFIKSDASIGFYCPNDMDDLINVLDYQKLLESARKAHEKDNLFK